MSKQSKNPFEGAKPAAKFAKTTAYQDRVNQELLRAMERIGDRLGRVEAERDHLSRKLSDLESHAVTDEDTGKLYLPVQVMEPAFAANQNRIRKASLLAVASICVAVFSFAALFYQNQVHEEQIAALSQVPQFAQLRPAASAWQPLQTLEEKETQAIAAPPIIIEDDIQTVSPDLADVTQTQEMADTEPSAGLEKPQAQEDEVFIEEVTKIEPAPKTDAAPVKTAALIKMPKPEVQSEPSVTAQGNMPARDLSLPVAFAGIEDMALKGDHEAQHDLATIYASGQGDIPVDFSRAAAWFEKAADGGIANADYNLGVMYHQGMGVAPDLKKALVWYKRAAEKDHPEAIYNLAIAYFEGIGVESDYTLAAALFKKAAALGVAQAAFNLGALYESDVMGAPNEKQALFWYSHAAKSGHTEARASLKRLTGVDPFSGSGVVMAQAIEPEAGAPIENPSSVADARIEKIIASDNPNQALIRDIQKVLVAMQLLPEPITGEHDLRTEDAIRAYQKKYDLYVDGVASAELLHHMIYDRGKTL